MKNYLKQTDLVRKIIAKVDDCKPRRRRSIDGNTTIYIINKLLEIKPISCLEIGTGDGYSTAIIGLCLQYNRKGKVYTISPDETADAHMLMRTLSLEGYVRFIRGYSPYIMPTVFSNFEYRLFNFVFIDGCHDLGAPALDFCCIRQYADSSNCFYMFHDVSHPDVKASLELIGKHYNLNVEYPYGDFGVIDLTKGKHE